MIRARALVGFLLVVCTLSACGGGGNSSESPPVVTPPPPPPPPANNAPQVTNLSVRTNEGETASGSLPATDSDNDTLSFVIVAEPQKGQVSLTNVNTGAFVYTPNVGEYGNDTFTFVANDGLVGSNVGTVDVQINRIPIATDVSRTIGSTDASQWNGILDGFDPDGDPIRFRFINGPSKGTLTNSETTTGTFTYQLNSGQSGTDSFEFEVSDGFATSDVARVTININQSPLALDDNFNVMREEPGSGTLGASDAENDTLRFRVETPPSEGVVIVTDDRNGTFTYTPNVGASGADSFTFVVSDAYSTSLPGSVDITFHEPPTVRFDVDRSYGVENKTRLIPLRLSSAIPFDIQVQIAVSGTATAVEDYEILSENPFTIPALSTDATFEIAIHEDTLVEDEWLTLEMTSAVRAEIDPAANQHRVTLADWHGTVAMVELMLPQQGMSRPGLTVDASGSIFIAGTTWVSNEKRLDVLVKKLDYRGVEQWTTTFAGPQEGSGNSADEEYATGVEIGSAGNIYVAGTEGYGNSVRGFLVKLDHEGNKVWHRTISGQSGGILINAMDTDSLDNVLVVGRTSGGVNGQPYLGGSDALLIKFDPDGNELWTRVFGTTGPEIAESVAVGSSGQVYVGIRGRGAYGLTAPTNHNDIFLTRFSASGTPEWTRTFRSPADDGIARIAVDSTDNIFLTGTVAALIDRPENEHLGSNDPYLAKFDKDGVEQWIRMFGDDEVIGAEGSYGLVLDPMGNAYLTGNWNSSSFNAKFDADGDLLWLDTPSVVGTLQPSGVILTSRRGWAIIEDNFGNFVVLGEGRNSGEHYLMKIDTAGAIFD